MAHTDARPTPGRYIRARDLAAMLAISQATLWRWSGNRIPAPVRLGPRVTAWKLDEVLAALERQPGGGA